MDVDDFTSYLKRRASAMMIAGFIAQYQKTYYDQLLAQGFSEEQAERIMQSSVAIFLESGAGHFVDIAEMFKRWAEEQDLKKRSQC